MAGTDSINIILFHHSQVFSQLLLRNASSGYRAEFMTVDPFKYDTLSIQRHNTVFHLKPAETDFLRYQFTERSVGIVNFDHQIIKFRFLCAPQFRIRNFPCTGICPCQLFLFLKADFAIVGKTETCLSCSPCFCTNLKTAFGQSLVRNRPYSEIADMYLRHSIQIYITVNSGKAEEILILAPAA